jgi:hypothetical protein
MRVSAPAWPEPVSSFAKVRRSRSPAPDSLADRRRVGERGGSARAMAPSRRRQHAQTRRGEVAGIARHLRAYASALDLWSSMWR